MSVRSSTALREILSNEAVVALLRRCGPAGRPLRLVYAERRHWSKATSIVASCAAELVPRVSGGATHANLARLHPGRRADSPDDLDYATVSHALPLAEAADAPHDHGAHAPAAATGPATPTRVGDLRRDVALLTTPNTIESNLATPVTSLLA